MAYDSTYDWYYDYTIRGDDNPNFIDAADYSSTYSNDRVYGYGGADTLYGYYGDDLMFGGAGGDKVYGEAGDDYVSGGSGNDVVSGGSGYDELFGDSGNDRLSGGTGGDDLYGGSGQDILTGGTGQDAFIFEFVSDSPAGYYNRDIITDFAQGQYGDVIDLRSMDSRTDLSGVQGPFSWDGYEANQANTDRGGVSYHFEGDNTIVAINTDADSTIESQIELTGRYNLTDYDFLL